MPDTEISTNPDRSTPAGGKSKQAAASRRGYLFGSALVLFFTAACILTFIGLIFRPKTDNGVRVWILNHTPDQVVIVNPFAGQVEKTFLVADGLKGLTFSRDNSKAYIYNVVDVSNRLTVIDAKTYLEEEVIEVDGVPQGMGVFPDNDKLAVILGSKTDFMAGGFDVLDLENPSKADARKQARLYRERDMQLTHKIAVGDDGDRIYCIDAKSSNINIFSLLEKTRIDELDLMGAAEEMFYPRVGNYYYATVLQHNAIYQINKATDQIEAAYTHMFHNPLAGSFGRLRHMAVTSDGRYLIAPVARPTGTKYVAIWDLKDRTKNATPGSMVPSYPDGVVFKDITYYTPAKGFALKGGYNAAHNFIPTGKQVAIDPFDEYLLVADEYGALYIYDMLEVMDTKYESTDDLASYNWEQVAELEKQEQKTLTQVIESRLKGLAVLEPHAIITEIADSTTEIRDIKVAQPEVSGVVKIDNDVSGG